MCKNSIISNMGQVWGFICKIPNLQVGPFVISSFLLLFSFFLFLRPLLLLFFSWFRQREKERESERETPRWPFHPKIEIPREKLESRTLTRLVGKFPLYFSLISSFRISRVSVKTRRIAPNWLFRAFVVYQVFICWFRVSICNQNSFLAFSQIWREKGCHSLEMTNRISTKTRIEIICAVNPNNSKVKGLICIRAGI